MGRWSRVAVFPVSEVQRGRGDGAADNALATSGLAHLLLRGPRAPVPPAAHHACCCSQFCVWSRREGKHLLPRVISSRPRGCPEGRGSHSDSWTEAASWGLGARCGCLHRRERSWPEKLPSPQTLMRAGKDPSADLTALPLPRTVLWMAHRSRCLQRPDLGPESLLKLRGIQKELGRGLGHL